MSIYLLLTIFIPSNDFFLHSVLVAALLLKGLHFNTLGLTLASADKLDTQDETRLSSLQSAISGPDKETSVRASPGPGRLIPSILADCLIFTGSGASR